MFRFFSAFLSLVLVFLFGTIIFHAANAPKEVQVTEYGVQITYADGTGYWWEFDKSRTDEPY